MSKTDCQRKSEIPIPKTEMTPRPDVATERIIYTGHVQGVGFRYTVRSIAKHHPSVTGYVRNLADGTVDLVAQGPAASINAFLAEVAARFRDHVQHCEREPVANPERFEVFDIRF
jgi:acylphosphatase